MLTIHELDKKYSGKNGAHALNQVSLTIGPGEIIGLFGENGAGKTTLLKSILGFTSYEGTIQLDGAPITSKNITRISFATIEHSFFPRMTAEQHADFYREQFPNFREKRFAGLMDFFDLPRGKAIRTFSQGQQNQFEVILALSQGADYILMDEPFAGNDLFNREDFYRLLAGLLEEQETVILSTHLIEEVSSFLSRVILMHKGQVIGDCTTEELEDEGRTLMDYVKESYSWQADRVAKALESMMDD